MTKIINQTHNLQIPHNFIDDDLFNMMIECEEICTFLAGLGSKIDKGEQLDDKDNFIITNILRSLSKFKNDIASKNNSEENEHAADVINSLLKFIEQINLQTRKYS